MTSPAPRIQVVMSDRIGALLARFREARTASRIFASDATLWGDAAAAEASIRLGWTHPFERAERIVASSLELRDTLMARGISRVLLCGMGGSSLGPEVVARWSGVPVDLLDTTHPATVRREITRDLHDTVVVVSSKSGTTVETRSQLSAFEEALRSQGLVPSQHIVVVTDPGSALAEYAAAQGYHCVLADPHVGGRFSVLTAFGLVPTTLAGADTSRLLREAKDASAALQSDGPENPALLLAAVLAEGLPSRYVALIAESVDARWGLGEWIEQLVAESTGKGGLGMLPIALTDRAPEWGEIPAQALRLRIAGTADTASTSPGEIVVSGTLGAQFLLWEVATAALGYALGVDPFNQPDVESAKIAARVALQSAMDAPHGGEPEGDAAAAVAAIRAATAPHGYVALQAFLDRTPERSRALETLRDELARALGVPVALGWGPRYLHSTGQFHKGGPAVGTFVQLLDAAAPELHVPGSDSGFGALIHAQARGDRDVLRALGRPVLTLNRDDTSSLVDEMIGALQA